MTDMIGYVLFFVLILTNTGIYVLIGAYFDGTLDDLDKMHDIFDEEGSER
tara:strand:+ start:602 stop:751 length:150 start_codon:yes stop_codon:yes gene_type:complete